MRYGVTVLVHTTPIVGDPVLDEPVGAIVFTRDFSYKAPAPGMTIGALDAAMSWSQILLDIMVYAGVSKALTNACWYKRKATK